MTITLIDDKEIIDVHKIWISSCNTKMYFCFQPDGAQDTVLLVDVKEISQ